MNITNGVVCGMVALLTAACQPLPEPVVTQSLPDDAFKVETTGFATAVSGYVRGVTADMAQDYDMGAAAYIATLAEDSDNVDLRRRVFELSLLDGNVSTAIRMARTLPLQTEQAMPALARVVGSLQEGHMDEARITLDYIIKLVPDLPQFRLMDAYVSVAEGKPVPQQVAMLEGFQVPDTLEARKQFHIGRLWLKVGDESKAKQALEVSNRLEPAALFTTVMLAEMEAGQGNLDTAHQLVEIFRSRNSQAALLEDENAALTAGFVHDTQPATLSQDAALTLFDFGLLVWTQGAINPARQLMNMANYLDPTNPYILYYGGVIDEAAGAYTAAQRKYMAINPHSPMVGLAAQIRLAEVTFRAGDEQQGMVLAKQLQRSRAQVPAIHRVVAEMAYDSGDYRTALKAYDTLLKTSDATTVAPPMLAAMYFARGASYERLGRLERAAEDLKMSLVLNPVNPNVLNYLGYMWAERAQNLQEATLLLERAHQAAPDDGAIMDSLGWAYYQQGQYDKALPLLEQAADKTPDDATVFLHLGDVYAKQNDIYAAERYWRLADKLLKADDDSRIRRDIAQRMRRMR